MSSIEILPFDKGYTLAQFAVPKCWASIAVSVHMVKFTAMRALPMDVDPTGAAFRIPIVCFAFDDCDCLLA